MSKANHTKNRSTTQPVSMLRTCDLTHDEHGWWMQYVLPDSVARNSSAKRCVLMEAMSATEAHLEALEEGFNVIAIIQ
jgi:hypothetical protein